MSGKVQITILLVILAVGSSGMQRAVQALARNPSVLFLAGQYKLMRGDTASALRLLQQAVAMPCARPANTSVLLSDCAQEHAVIISRTESGLVRTRGCRLIA